MMLAGLQYLRVINVEIYTAVPIRNSHEAKETDRSCCTDAGFLHMRSINVICILVKRS